MLPPEYSLTVWFPGSAGATARVAFVHGRKARLPEIAGIVNRSAKARVFLPSLLQIDGESLNVYSRAGDRALAVAFRVKRVLRRFFRR